MAAVTYAATTDVKFVDLMGPLPAKNVGGRAAPWLMEVELYLASRPRGLWVAIHGVKPAKAQTLRAHGYTDTVRGGTVYVQAGKATT